MKDTYLTYLDIRPIEDKDAMGIPYIPDIRKKMDEIEQLPRALAVPRGDGTYIMPDGHRRTLAFLLKSKFEIPFRVLETDADIRNFPCWFFTNPERRIRRVDTVRRIYEQEIRPVLESEGIRRVTDYPVFKEMVRRGYLSLK